MKIVAAMSGGVDSSVAAVMLKQAGHEVLGVYLRMRSPVAQSNSNCISPQHEEDAREVAHAAGIEFQTLDMREAFEESIVQPFLNAYLAGETPNPCVACNLHVKLGPLIDWAVRQGFDTITTGHYARINDVGGRFRLMRGIDPTKDQSYYLCALRTEHLARMILPLGDLQKTQTRALAEEWKLPVAAKADSQDICLTAGDGDYRRFLERRMGAEMLLKEGPILSTNGEVLGRHTGLANYTVGQRRGLGLSHPRPLYVVALRPEENALIVGEEKDLYETTLEVRDFNWSGIEAPGNGSELRALVQIRYQHKASPATVRVQEAGRLTILFDQPQRAIAPGQVAAVYDGEMLLGGGIIMRR